MQRIYIAVIALSFLAACNKLPMQPTVATALSLSEAASCNRRTDVEDWDAYQKSLRERKTSPNNEPPPPPFVKNLHEGEVGYVGHLDSWGGRVYLFGRQEAFPNADIGHEIRIIRSGNGVLVDCESLSLKIWTQQHAEGSGWLPVLRMIQRPTLRKQ